MVIGILAFTCKDEERLAKDQTDKAINLSVEIYFWQVNEKEEIGSTQMKSVLCHQATLQVVDQPNLTPAKGQVLLEVVRCGICGSDLHM
ncbi:MAG: hypothetical protein E6Z46_02885, partial [Acinetobacter sp.]|nr:hypothetical protein [Acinetobacter sp.]